MYFSYDPRDNAAYLRFAEKPAGVETIRVSDELWVDIAPRLFPQQLGSQPGGNGL